jgi:hypothetical protein
MEYPQTPSNEMKGNVVVRMSIDADGRLAAVTLVSSSDQPISITGRWRRSGSRALRTFAGIIQFVTAAYRCFF